MAADDSSVDQRRRLVSAFTSTATAKRLEHITIADIVSRAGLPCEAFHRCFDSVRDCWRAGFEDLAVQLERAMSDTSAAGTPLRQFDALLAAFFDTLLRDTAASRVYLTRLYAADTHVTGRRRELQGRFVARLADIFDAHTTAGLFACQVLAAATTNLTTDALIGGDVDSVLALRRPLLLFAEQTLD